MDGGLSVIAVAIIKLGTALGASTGLISLLKWFNTYDYKGAQSKAKKGGKGSVNDDLDDIRERVGSKSKLY